MTGFHVIRLIEALTDDVVDIGVFYYEVITSQQSWELDGC